MRRLRDFQIVGLQVADIQATCRIIAVGGDEAVLEPRSISDLASVTLSAPATLSFEAERHPVLLSGLVGDGPIAGSLAFWITDAVGRGELRLRPRLQAGFAISLRPQDGSGPRVSRETTDLSAGGVLVAGYRVEPGTILEVQLTVPGLPRLVTCRARAVRQLPAGAAIEFIDLEPGLGRVLDQFVFAVRQQVARRAFAQNRTA